MSTYSIVWETEGVEAENPIDAAQIAFDQIQEGYATSFTLLNEQTGEMHAVDLSEIEDEYLCRVTKYVSVFERNKKQ